MIPITVLIVDDQSLVRSAIKNLLSLRNEIGEIREADSGQACLDMLETWKPDIILMDIRMPGMTGIETISHLKAIHPKHRTLLLTTFDEAVPIRQGVALGAKGCLLKSANTEQLITAITKTRRNGKYMEPSLIDAQANTNYLTRREFEIILAMSRGKSNQEISEQMDISIGTVKVHASSSFEKLQVRDRTQAVLKAQRIGLI